MSTNNFQIGNQQWLSSSLLLSDDDYEDANTRESPQSPRSTSSRTVDRACRITNQFVLCMALGALAFVGWQHRQALSKLATLRLATTVPTGNWEQQVPASQLPLAEDGQ